MKEALKSASGLKASDTLRATAIHIAVAMVSFLTARAPVMDTFAPFGIAFAAGMPKIYILTAGIGAAAGYFSPTLSGGAFRYFAAIFAVCTIRLLLYEINKLGKKPLFSAITAFAASLSTNLATAAGGHFSPLFAATEAVFAFAGAYFVHRAATLFTREKAGLSAEQLASAIMTVNMVLLGLYPLNIGGVSVGRVLASAAVITVARFSRAAGGAVAGCVCSIFLVLCGKEYASAAVIFAVGGLLCGVFSSLGKIASSGIFLLWSAVGALLLDGSLASLLLVAETAFGAAVAILLPSKLCTKIGKIFSPPANVPSLEGLRRALTMRLFFASDALMDVSETVREVSNELSQINAPDFDWVLSSVREDACKGCSLCSYCWERKRRETHDAVLYMTKLIKGGEREPHSLAPDEWQGRCLRTGRVGKATVKYFDEYASKIAAETRIEEIRQVVSDQFDGISNMLFELGQEFETCETFDTTLAAAVSAALKDIDILATDAACKIDKYGRLSLELRAHLQQHAPINRMDVLQIAEAVCEREFEPPIVTRVKNEVFIRLCEKALFTAQIGVCQIIAGGGNICGDAYTHFFDGKGHAILILSDGMGTGGRAAVDGAMASGLMERLLKAGFGYDCALRIVNSSLLFKSTDESLATVDIASLDLFTGAVDLYKVGAAPSILRRGSRTGKAESTSLPAGILRDIGFDKATVTLRHGDIVLLMSDGAVSDGTEWICAELESYKCGSAQTLAEKIANGARRRRQDGHEDDITVMAAILEKAI